MRVTIAVREYVRKVVLAKVADRIKEAEKARDEAMKERDDKVAKAEGLCKKICAEAQEKFVKEAKKLGLTFIPDTYECNRVRKGDNLAVYASVDYDDFVETLTSRRDGIKAKSNPCAARDEFDRVVGEPARIKDAVTAAADRLLFELELGKVAKKELDEMLKSLEVEL